MCCQLVFEFSVGFCQRTESDLLLFLFVCFLYINFTDSQISNKRHLSPSFLKQKWIKGW